MFDIKLGVVENHFADIIWKYRLFEDEAVHHMFGIIA